MVVTLVLSLFVLQVISLLVPLVLVPPLVPLTVLPLVPGTTGPGALVLLPVPGPVGPVTGPRIAGPLF